MTSQPEDQDQSEGLDDQTIDETFPFDVADEKIDDAFPFEVSIEMNETPTKPETYQEMYDRLKDDFTRFD